MQTKRMNIDQSAWYWGGLVLFGSSVLAVALYYQYGLDAWPCVLCIHARIWVLGIILAALLGLLMRHNRPINALAHGLVLVMSIGLLERAWKLLGTERGTLFGECSMDLGLPPWLALDQWWPQVFEAQTSCGYTPELWAGITMAEALLGMALTLMLISVLQLLAALLNRVRQA